VSREGQEAKQSTRLCLWIRQDPEAIVSTANQLRFNWELLGFDSKQQASTLLTIMRNDTPVESRQMLLKQFMAKAMLRRGSRKQHARFEEDDNNVDQDEDRQPSSTKRTNRKQTNDLTFICRPMKTKGSGRMKHGVVLKSAQRSQRKSQFRLTANLPHIVLSLGEGLGEEEDKFVRLKGALDNCAGGTIGYCPYHDSIRTHYPHLVKD
jgi:hypothetical protein